MNATHLYVSTCRLVMQADPENRETWTELYKLLPYLRQSLSCTVCGKLLTEPFTPTETNCQHHVCRKCIGGKKRLKPTCSWCKDYETYIGSAQVSIVLQCYRKLCEYIKITPIYRKLSTIYNNGGQVSLMDMIEEAVGSVKEKEEPNQLTVTCEVEKVSQLPSNSPLATNSVEIVSPHQVVPCCDTVNLISIPESASLQAPVPVPVVVSSTVPVSVAVTSTVPVAVSTATQVPVAVSTSVPIQVSSPVSVSVVQSIPCPLPPPPPPPPPLPPPQTSSPPHPRIIASVPSSLGGGHGGICGGHSGGIGGHSIGINSGHSVGIGVGHGGGISTVHSGGINSGSGGGHTGGISGSIIGGHAGGISGGHSGGICGGHNGGHSGGVGGGISGGIGSGHSGVLSGIHGGVNNRGLNCGKTGGPGSGLKGVSASTAATLGTASGAGLTPQPQLHHHPPPPQNHPTSIAPSPHRLPPQTHPLPLPQPHPPVQSHPPLLPQSHPLPPSHPPPPQSMQSHVINQSHPLPHSHPSPLPPLQSHPVPLPAHPPLSQPHMLQTAARLTPIVSSVQHAPGTIFPSTNIAGGVKDTAFTKQNSSVSNGSSVYSVMYSDGESTKITIKRKPPEVENANKPIVPTPEFITPSPEKPKAKPKPKPKRKGCRCGNATATPGKLTCCGQRCPCYVEAKSCIECRCRGCRNPHRPGGKKVRPVIPQMANIQIHPVQPVHGRNSTNTSTASTTTSGTTVVTTTTSSSVPQTIRTVQAVQAVQAVHGVGTVQGVHQLISLTPGVMQPSLAAGVGMRQVAGLAMKPVSLALTPISTQLIINDDKTSSSYASDNSDVDIDV